MTNEPDTRITVIRTVAGHIGIELPGEHGTVIMSADQAIELGSALIELAREVRGEGTQ